MSGECNIALELAKQMYPDAEVLSAQFIEDSEGNQILKFHVRLSGAVHYVDIQGTITDD